jgi:hypothetical protein
MNRPTRTCKTCGCARDASEFISQNGKQEYVNCLTCRGQVRPTRGCHDCGAPTFNYRCDACWVKVLKSVGESVEPGARYSGDEYGYGPATAGHVYLG